MPLDFRSREEEGFSVKRFLKTVGAGVAVFLGFLAVGYYLVGPRITVSETGRIQLRLMPPPNAGATDASTAARPEPPIPKVEVYEKLPSTVTAGTGVIIGSREVAPFDYERYERKQRERRAKQEPAPTPNADDDYSPMEDEYFIPDEEASSDTPGLSEPQEPAPTEPNPTEPSPTEPSPTEPPPSPEPTAPSQPSETQASVRYRVQVGVYESRENANQTAQRLIASGYQASIIPFQRNGKTMYRVQTFVTSDRVKAESLKSKLESQGFPAAVVQVQ
ncbi:MAG: SPOR domain-containing protein [Fimbriimonadales bacterium]